MLKRAGGRDEMRDLDAGHTPYVLTPGLDNVSDELADEMALPWTEGLCVNIGELVQHQRVEFAEKKVVDIKLFPPWLFRAWHRYVGKAAESLKGARPRATAAPI